MSIDIAAILSNAGADADAPEGSQAWALAQVAAAVGELKQATAVYFTHYMQDEAADDGVEWTGCSTDQHLAAYRVHVALVRVGSVI